MKKLSLWLIFIYLIKRLIFPLPVYAAAIAGNSAMLIDTAYKNELDIRARQLEEFLKSYNSPLAAYSDYFVQMADKYEIDWKLLPAITGVESTFGKKLPSGSYNAYGWNGGKYYFNSWEESIEEVSKTLSEKYYQRGLNTPYKIAPVYCPPSNTWARKVTFFIRQLEGFEKKVILQISPLLAI